MAQAKVLQPHHRHAYAQATSPVGPPRAWWGGPSVPQPLACHAQQVRHFHQMRGTGRPLNWSLAPSQSSKTEPWLPKTKISSLI